VDASISKSYYDSKRGRQAAARTGCARLSYQGKQKKGVPEKEEKLERRGAPRERYSYLRVGLMLASTKRIELATKEQSQVESRKKPERGPDLN